MLSMSVHVDARADRPNARAADAGNLLLHEEAVPVHPHQVRPPRKLCAVHNHSLIFNLRKSRGTANLGDLVQ